MKILRFVLPFLFVRNWHDGAWEFSRARCILSCSVLVLLVIGLVIISFIQAPITYVTPTS